ncbi:hypothetical protein B484DRAFT_469259 [Ochromonadaceae sp. CCMP2298]|nr:hypothetical protein B484DRAFT_469259 [Ochromonadaceae sp. CCMP2298]
MMQVEEEIYHEVGRLQVQEVGRLQVQKVGRLQVHILSSGCGGEFVHGEPNAGCCENEETGAWTCHCREGGPVKKNYELIFLLFKMVYKAKLHLSKDFKSEWTIFCNNHLAVDCPTFSRFLPIDYAQLRKKFNEILKAIIVELEASRTKMHVKRNKKDTDRLKSSKIGWENEFIPRQTYTLPSDRQRALDAETEAEAEEVDEEEDEEGVARPVIERTIDEEACTETIRTANKPQNGDIVLGLDPNAPQPLRVAAAKRPPRPADPVLAFLMNRMNPAKQEVIDVDADDEELQALMEENAAMKKLEKKEKIKQETEQMRRKLSESSTSTTASTEGLEEMQARDAYPRQEVYNRRSGGRHDWCQDIAQERQRKLDHIKTRDHFLGPHSAREGSYAHESRKPFTDERRTYHRPSPEVSSLGCESAAPFEYKPAAFEQTDRMVWQPHHSPMVYDYKQARYFGHGKDWADKDQEHHRLQGVVPQGDEDNSECWVEFPDENRSEQFEQDDELLAHQRIVQYYNLPPSERRGPPPARYFAKPQYPNTSRGLHFAKRLHYMGGYGQGHNYDESKGNYMENEEDYDAYPQHQEQPYGEQHYGRRGHQQSYGEQHYGQRGHQQSYGEHGDSGQRGHQQSYGEQHSEQRGHQAYGRHEKSQNLSTIQAGGTNGPISISGSGHSSPPGHQVGNHGEITVNVTMETPGSASGGSGRRRKALDLTNIDSVLHRSNGIAAALASAAALHPVETKAWVMPSHVGVMKSC